jgi:aspartate aminotransferase-like enzyme
VHRKAVEIRLLAVSAAYRKTTVFVGLIALLADYFKGQGCDLAVISGTVRQLKLYRHLGFQAFAQPVGTPSALYQPMFLTLEALNRVAAVQSPPPAPVCTVVSFLPGPVALTPQVAAAFQGTPVSHREPRFTQMMTRVRAALTTLVNARYVALMIGTGTLANDAIAAQLQCIGGSGLILANGEFGERLMDHARRWRLSFNEVRHAWGQPIDWPAVQRLSTEQRPAWLWAVLSETSTGVTNHLDRLLALSRSLGADLCIDAVSAIGLIPVDLHGIRFASAVSGKGLAAPPGLAAVFHDGRIAAPGTVPRYLDLATYEVADGVPFTHSSNLLAALDQSLACTRWPTKFERVRNASATLNAVLRAQQLPPLAAEDHATPGITTVVLPPDVDAEQLGAALSRQGIQIAYQSDYLKRRNWIQICLMGDFDESVLFQIPDRLTALVRQQRSGDRPDRP